jgi:hypothetical protein
MMVNGLNTNPTAVRATAPDRRLPVGDKVGSAEAADWACGCGGGDIAVAEAAADGVRMAEDGLCARGVVEKKWIDVMPCRISESR